MRKVYFEAYCEIPSAYFVPLKIHDCQSPILLTKMNGESHLFQICMQLKP